MQRAFGTLALVALLVLAGCGQPFGSGGTDAPVADGASGDATVASDDLPPGVSETGVENATALLAAHRAALVESGFESAARRNGTARRDSETVAFDEGQRVVAAPGAETYSSRVVMSGPGTAYEFWSNGSVELVRAQIGGTTRYRRGSGRSAGALTSVGLLGSSVVGGNYTPTSVEGSGDGRRITLQARTLDEPSRVLPANATDVSGYASTLVLDGEGRVRSLETVANYTIGGREARFELRYALRQVGGVTVERPDWVGTALNGSGENGSAADGSATGGSVTGGSATDGATGSIGPVAPAGSGVARFAADSAIASAGPDAAAIAGERNG
ncbi:hypothetical protein BRC90_11105 [Halobacteriales archaeon QS_4_69_34]|nr:MAG: hypothetical protein BRC90_11105 [Halobacteriales archaeon QS_4_69_34]